jgi:hypothetical protein
MRRVAAFHVGEQCFTCLHNIHHVRLPVDETARRLLRRRVLCQLKSQPPLAEVRKRPTRLVGHQGVRPGADAVGAAQSRGDAFVGVVAAVCEAGRVLRGGLVLTVEEEATLLDCLDTERLAKVRFCRRDLCLFCEREWFLSSSIWSHTLRYGPSLRLSGICSLYRC